MNDDKNKVPTRDSLAKTVKSGDVQDRVALSVGPGCAGGLDLDSDRLRFAVVNETVDAHQVRLRFRHDAGRYGAQGIQPLLSESPEPMVFMSRWKLENDHWIP